MESYTSEEDSETKFTVEQGSTEEGFIKGFEDNEEPDECAECGAAINPEKLVVKEIENESYKFCSEDCAKDYEESVN